MKIITVLIMAAVFSSCQTSSEITKDHEENPCYDTQYLILKKMKESELTSGQAEYLKMKEEECEKFTSSHSKRSLDKKQADSNLIWILSVIGGLMVIGLIIGLSLKNGHGHW